MHPSSYYIRGSFVYVIEYITRGGIEFYIGATRNVQRRFENHLAHRHNRLYNPIESEQDYFELVGVIMCETWIDALTIEKALQQHCKSLKNGEIGKSLKELVVYRYNGEWFVYENE